MPNTSFLLCFRSQMFLLKLMWFFMQALLRAGDPTIARSIYIYIDMHIIIQYPFWSNIDKIDDCANNTGKNKNVKLYLMLFQNTNL